MRQSRLIPSVLNKFINRHASADEIATSREACARSHQTGIFNVSERWQSRIILVMKRALPLRRKFMILPFNGGLFGRCCNDSNAFCQLLDHPNSASKTTWEPSLGRILPIRNKGRKSCASTPHALRFSEA
jgi:hypothetical protein